MLSPFFIFFSFLFGLILLSNSPPSPVLSLQQANSNNGNATSLMNDTGGLRDTSVLSLWNSSIRLAKKKGAHRVMHWSKENFLRKSFFQLPHNTIQILCENYNKISKNVISKDLTLSLNCNRSIFNSSLLNGFQLSQNTNRTNQHPRRKTKKQNTNAKLNCWKDLSRLHVTGCTPPQRTWFWL